jgi:hypothetical protein
MFVHHMRYFSSEKIVPMPEAYNFCIVSVLDLEKDSNVQDWSRQVIKHSTYINRNLTMSDC